jgi:hypothetical protein
MAEEVAGSAVENRIKEVRIPSMIREISQRQIIRRL